MADANDFSGLPSMDLMDFLVLEGPAQVGKAKKLIANHDKYKKAIEKAILDLAACECRVEIQEELERVLNK